MRDGRRMRRVDDVQRDSALVDPVEEAQSIAEEDGGDGDGEVIDQTGVEGLHQNAGAAADSNILVFRGGARLAQRALDSVVDEVERRSTLPFPRLFWVSCPPT